MKKIIVIMLLILTSIICYVAGYIWATDDITSPNVKEREYIMHETTTPTKDVDVTAKEDLTYILYPLYGEILIYQSDGNFYDYTGIWLCNLSTEDQIEILNRKRVFTREELYTYLEALTS